MGDSHLYTGGVQGKGDGRGSEIGRFPFRRWLGNIGRVQTNTK